MTSITTLGYGLAVLAPELITAAQAWPAIEQTLKFFDLLFLRKKKGTLSCRGRMKGLVDHVPVEVWEEIRDWTAFAEKEDAENKWLAPYFDYFLDEEFEGDYPAKMSWEFMRKEVLGSDLGEWLYQDDAWLDMLGRFTGQDPNDFVPVQKLLAAFGLAHPLSFLITVDPGSWHELDNIALLTIPSRAQRQDSLHSTISAKAGYDQQDEHTLINVSIDLPLNADTRFRRFIRTFDLQVVEVSQSTLRCVAPDPDTKNNSRTGLAGIKRDEVKSVKEIKPRWMLYTSCWADY
ncbi:uncharacterized protein JCM6883_004422 [Sporobolomyces salmoneus]|uniref:uncharacterized protein n=1 Tax=Sporobolomyces salmoneus TaxID=183962 RepID=UPI0031758F7A